MGDSEEGPGRIGSGGGSRRGARRGAGERVRDQKRRLVLEESGWGRRG